MISVLFLFAASGCAALIYEVVWYQQLQLVLGSTTVSLGILLATFMGGLSIGSLAFPRLRLTRRNPLKVFGAIEAAIAACGVMVTLAMPFISRSLSQRSVLAVLVMLPATMFMGASFPAIVRWVEHSPGFTSRWALLYGSNTAGAVCGSLFAGFYLLRVYNMTIAACVAVSMNLLVAIASWLISNQGARTFAAWEENAQISHSPAWPVYITIAISGFTALAAEVIWTRLLSMVFLGTVYIFSIILAVFLSGLALGGGLASRLLRRGPEPRIALGWCQVLIAIAIAWTAVSATRLIPAWTAYPTHVANSWLMFLLDLILCLAAILPAAVLWGASFPLACAAAGANGHDAAKVAGPVYAANTLGAIAGALIVSLLLIPGIGSQNSERVIMGVSVIAGFVVFLRGARVQEGLAGLAALALIAVIPPIPGELIAYGRDINQYRGQSQVLWMAEGLNSSVAITKWPSGAVYINVNGHVEATTEPYDMKLQRMVGHLPALMHSHPRSVLGIGFGAGVSAGVFTRYPGVERITVCEIEPVIPPASDRFFAPQNYRVYRDPRTHIVYDDARHYLLTTTDTFDIIASDPLDVFIKGTAALYTREYFTAVKRRLNPGGYFSLYVPLYETDEPTIKSELETFFSVFSYATVWSNTRAGQGYDLVFLGQAEPFRLDLDEVQQRLDRADYVRVRNSLLETDMHSAADLLGTYVSSAAGLRPWTAGAQVNTDADLRLSYLAGWGINANLADAHYQKMLVYRQDPGRLFLGSPRALRALENSLLRESQ